MIPTNLGKRLTRKEWKHQAKAYQEEANQAALEHIETIFEAQDLQAELLVYKMALLAIGGNDPREIANYALGLVAQDLKGNA